MKDSIAEHHMVALLEDMQATHFKTKKPLTLQRGQIGTVVMVHEGAVEVEFAGRDGRPYALLPIHPGKLIVLKDFPDLVAA